MNIVVLAGGLSTERDVSFKTGSMVAKALKENGHKVILLDVFMGYSDKEEDLTGPDIVKKIVKIMLLNRDKDKNVLEKIKKILLDWEE